MRNETYRSWLLATLLTTFIFGCSTVGAGGIDRMSTIGAPVPPSKQGEAYGRFLRALLEERHGNFGTALKEMEQVSKLDPGEMTPLFHLVRGYMRQEDHSKGRDVVERMLKEHPENANLWALLGRILYREEELEGAMDAFNKAIQLEPRNLANLGALIELQEATNSIVDSIEIFEQLVEHNPDSARLYFQLGLNLTRIEDTEGARAALEKAVELNPNLARVHYLLGLIYLENGENEKAIDSLRIYLGRRTDAFKAYEYLVGGLTRMGRYEEALETLREAMKTPFVNTTAHLEGVYIHLLWGEGLDAAEELIPPSGAPYFGQLFRAIVRDEKGDPYLALLESLDNTDGDLDRECTTYISELLYLFTYETFGEWFIGRLEKYRREVDSHTLDFMLARTHMVLEETRKAVDIFEGMLDAHGPDKTIHYYLAIAYESMDDFENTERQLKAFLEIEPEDPDMLNFLGYLYAEHSVHLEEAEDMLHRALDQDPENPYYLDSLGWIYYKQGKPQEALELIQQAVVGMESEDAILRDHLGDVYLKLGDRKQAVREWERSFRIDGSNEEVKRKIERYSPRE